MKIDPDLEDIERFVAERPDEPVVMLNLLRFREGGAEKYADYLRHALPYAEAAGVKVLYYGVGTPPLVGGSGQGWDAVAVVSYPSRKAFSDMVSQPGYPARLRAEALAETVLQPTADASATVGPARLRGAVTGSVRWTSGAFGGVTEPLIRLCAIHPGRKPWAALAIG